MNESVVIRDLVPEKDMDGVFNCYAEGFRHIIWPILDHAEKSLHQDILRFFLAGASDGFVAEHEGEVHGVLLGSIPERAGRVLYMLSYGAFRLLPPAAARSHGMDDFARRAFFRLLCGYAPHLLRHPVARGMAEVLLFTSRRALRGRGMGRMLMDAYMARARQRGARVVFVCTDTALSYHFYEAYGFSRVRSFPMTAYRESLPGETHQGLIYRLDLA